MASSKNTEKRVAQSIDADRRRYLRAERHAAMLAAHDAHCGALKDGDRRSRVERFEQAAKGK